jgi:two-component system response regulator TrcR
MITEHRDIFSAYLELHVVRDEAEDGPDRLDLQAAHRSVKGRHARAQRQRPRQAILGQLPRIHRADGSPIRVLLVDDEPALTNLVTMALHYEGWVVDVAHDGREAIAKFDKIGPDVLVLDIMLPDTDGLEILQRIRVSGAYTPTLFLTARDSVRDRVTGLTAGADDYMTKPFSLEELVARLRGLLRRSTHLAPPADETLNVGDLRLDTASHEVTRAGAPVPLTSTEFELLRFLMRNPRRALSRTEILDRVWNYDFAGRTSIVDLYISYLRKKIDAGKEPMIHTVRGVGYMLRPPE